MHVRRLIAPALVVALTALTALTFAACGDEASKSDSLDISSSESINGPEPTCGKRAGGTMRLGLSQSLISWDINQHPFGDLTTVNATNLVFDRLVRPSLDLQTVENRLATSIEANADFTEWRIKIRPGVRFHDGSELDSGDVAFSFSYYLKGASGFAFGPVKDITTPDPKTVVITYSESYADLPEEGLAAFSGSIIPNKFGGLSPEEFWRKPIGTGPFKVVSSNPGAEIVLERNPDYWDGAPNLSRVEMKIVTDPSNRLLGLESGTFDLIDGVPPDRASTLSSGAAARILKPSTVTDLLLVSATTPLLRDRSVRRAMAHAINREEIAEAAYNGLAEPTTQLIPAAQPFSTEAEDPPTFDLKQAEELMAKSKFPDGGKVQLEYAKGDTALQLQAELLKEQLAQIGVDAHLVPLGPAEYFDRAQSGKQQLGLVHSESVVTDSYDLLSYDLATDGFFGGWPTDEVAGYEERFRSTDDKRERGQIIQAYENYVAAEARQIPTVAPFWLNGQQESAAGVKMSLINEWYLDRAWLCE